MKKDEMITAGGQAVIEGVMMRSKDRIAIAVRQENNKITIKKEKHQPLSERNKLVGLPIIRGIANIIEMMIVGISALNFSANKALGEDEELSVFQVGLSIFLALLFTIVIFKFAPLLIAQLMQNAFLAVKENYLLFNLIDGGIRILLFLMYIFVISFMADIKTLFMYHGAEHKAVNCYENLCKNEKKISELNIKNVQKFSTLHPRCGTSFIIIVLILSVLTYSFIPKESSFTAKLLLRILLLPLIAGISYEVLKLGGKYRESIVMKIIVWPGLQVQKLTTKEPTDKQVEVAIRALKAVI